MVPCIDEDGTSPNAEIDLSGDIFIECDFVDEELELELVADSANSFEEAHSGIVLGGKR